MGDEERGYEQSRDMPGQYRFDGTYNSPERPLFNDIRSQHIPTLEQAAEERSLAPGNSLYTGILEPGTPSKRLY